VNHGKIRTNNQLLKAMGNATNPSAVQSLHSHSIGPMNDIGLCHGQLEAPLTQGSKNFQLVSVEK
jgi:hypothetical protein